MKIAYFALVSFDDYVPGDIVPGASAWPYISAYASEGKVAPVLVATLPKGLQDKLKAWEKEHDPDVLRAKAEAEAKAAVEAEAAAKEEAEAEARATAEAEAEAALEAEIAAEAEADARPQPVSEEQSDSPQPDEE